MRNLAARLITLEQKNPKPCTAEQGKAFRDILFYLDSLADRKASGGTFVQVEIDTVNQFQKSQLHSKCAWIWMNDNLRQVSELNVTPTQEMLD